MKLASVEIECLGSAVLMPDEDGNLASFFTTARCYFHPIGERILAEDPHTWI